MTPETWAEAWENHAGWWQAGFADGTDAEYAEQILPLAAEHLSGRAEVLDVGAGEGQVARHLAGAGARRVVGVEPSLAQVGEARRRGGGPRYARARAGSLPFPAASFDAVVVTLVLEHVDDAPAAIVDIGRVLRSDGRLLLFLNHPLLQAPNSGWIDDHVLDPPEQYWRIGPYLVEDRRLEEVEKGVHIPFVHRPLSRYVNAVADAGLVVRHMAEPPPPPGFLERAHEYADAATIPRLLVLVADKLDVVSHRPGTLSAGALPRHDLTRNQGER